MMDHATTRERRGIMADEESGGLSGFVKNDGKKGTKDR